MGIATATPVPARPDDAGSIGNDRLLLGMVLGVVTFWLFAQSTLNVAPVMQRALGVGIGTMNAAVAMAALFSGLFVVMAGGLGDRFGRVRVLRIGFVLGIAGSLLVGLAPAGGTGAAMLLSGRAVQGLSAACILPSSLALVKAYWDGAARQRAVSLWSIGAWGGAGFASLFGGFIAQSLGWRWIFFLSVAVSLLGLWLVRGTPESKVQATRPSGFDPAGALATVFALFRNRIFTGATVSNFLLNATVGIQLVSLQLVQVGGGMGAQEAGMLTMGYAVTIIAFIRVGEKLLQRHGPRRPMALGCAITGLAIIFLMPTHMMLGTYRLAAMAGYALFGLGLAFYATPATDAALSNLPMEQSGAGAGLFKMASSLGAALGVAVSGTLFGALGGADGGVAWLEGVLTFQGRTDNLAIRQAAMVALGFNLLLVAAALATVLRTIPAGGAQGARAR